MSHRSVELLINFAFVQIRAMFISSTVRRCQLRLLEAVDRALCDEMSARTEGPSTRVLLGRGTFRMRENVVVDEVQLFLAV